MKRLLLGAAGAFAVAAVGFSGAAQAQCWWNGMGYACAAPPQTYYSPYPYGNTATPYAAWNAWDYRDYRYNPSWLPSYPGPKLSGH